MIHHPQIHRNANRLPNDDPRPHHEVQNRPNIALPAGTSNCRQPGILVVARHEQHIKVSATVLNNVNDRFDKRFSNSSFVQCIDRDVGFFEAWVSVFDGVLNWKSRLRTLRLAGEAECGPVCIQNSGDATTRGIASCFGASMTPCLRSGVQSPGRRFSLTDRWLPPELICPNHGVENGDEFPHRSGERHLLEFSLRQQSRYTSRGHE